MKTFVKYERLWCLVQDDKQVKRLKLKHLASVSRDTFLQVLKPDNCYKKSCRFGLTRYTPAPALWRVQ